MLSAKDGEYDQADGLDCGADDYLTKPFSYVVLLARLRALLRRGAPRAADRADASATSTLDPARRRVTVAGAEVALTAREFALLEYLMRRAGEVVSKTELLDHVWDASAGDRAERGRGLHRLPAPQDRPGPAGDGARRRLPAGRRDSRA